VRDASDNNSKTLLTFLILWTWSVQPETIDGFDYALWGLVFQ